MSKHQVDQSWALYDEAIEHIPMGSQTHSKAPREALRGIEPCYLVKGKGCRVWDLDGNEYIDFRNGLGPITLGYGIPAVDEALRRRVDEGIIFSYPHPLEAELAARLVQWIPCAEQVRFLKTGGEAMAATHRLARVHTQRDRLLTCGYHGWLNSQGAGVPAATRATYTALPWGDISPYEEAFAKNGDAIAAVSVACAYAEAELGGSFLPQLRELTLKHGALLIFDEIVTGFRLDRAGAQAYFDVEPDMAVFAKGMSNGVPLSCYVGRQEVMALAQVASISSTFGGDTLGLAAAVAVLDIYESEDVVETLWGSGRQLQQGFNGHCKRLGLQAGLRGLAPMPQWVFDAADAKRNSALFLRFNAELLKRGVIVFSVCYPNFSHAKDDIDCALSAMAEALEVMADDGLFATETAV